MYGLCRVRSSAIEGLAALMNINSEQQSGDAGAAIKLDLRRTCDGVQMSTCVHITHHSQILGFWVPAQSRSLMHWRRDRTTRCLSSLPINKRRELLEDVPLVEAVGIPATKEYSLANQYSLRQYCA